MCRVVSHLCLPVRSIKEADYGGGGEDVLSGRRRDEVGMRITEYRIQNAVLPIVMNEFCGELRTCKGSTKTKAHIEQ